MNSASFTQGAAFDLHSLDSLKLSAKNNSQDGIKAVAKQMEGLFVQMMLKSMRSASFKDGLFNSQQTEMFTSMYDQQIAQNIAERGNMGVADMMVKQLGGQAETPASVSGGSPRPLTLSNGVVLPYQRGTGIFPRSDNPYPQRAEMSPGGGQNNSFISRLMAPALEAARNTGIPHQLIIAQAALESGWGNKEILTQSGKPSHNLFGIKATPDWGGETTEITTTEYIDGVAHKIKSAFRVYQSYSEALSDYTALLTRNPRYQNITKSRSPETAAHALQAGGYATDPNYAKKVISIIQQVRNNVNQAIDSYKTDLSQIF